MNLSKDQVNMLGMEEEEALLQQALVLSMNKNESSNHGDDDEKDLGMQLALLEMSMDPNTVADMDIVVPCPIKKQELGGGTKPSEPPQLALASPRKSKNIQGAIDGNLVASGICKTTAQEDLGMQMALQLSMSQGGNTLNVSDHDHTTALGGNCDSALQEAREKDQRELNTLNEAKGGVHFPKVKRNSQNNELLQNQKGAPAPKETNSNEAALQEATLQEAREKDRRELNALKGGVRFPKVKRDSQSNQLSDAAPASGSANHTLGGNRPLTNADSIIPSHLLLSIEGKEAKRSLGGNRPLTNADSIIPSHLQVAEAEDQDEEVDGLDKQKRTPRRLEGFEPDYTVVVKGVKFYHYRSILLMGCHNPIWRENLCNNSQWTVKQGMEPFEWLELYKFIDPQNYISLEQSVSDLVTNDNVEAMIPLFDRYGMKGHVNLCDQVLHKKIKSQWLEPPTYGLWQKHKEALPTTGAFLKKTKQAITDLAKLWCHWVDKRTFTDLTRFLMDDECGDDLWMYFVNNVVHFPQAMLDEMDKETIVGSPLFQYMAQTNKAPLESTDSWIERADSSFCPGPSFFAGGSRFGPGDFSEGVIAPVSIPRGTTKATTAPPYKQTPGNCTLMINN